MATFTLDLTVNTDEVDAERFEQIVATAGGLVGLGDWRPRFGRFAASVAWS